MRVLQKKSVAGLFNQADFNIRQQGQQVARGFGGHQAVQAAKQVQLRAAVGLQGRAGIQLREQFQARHQRIGRRIRCPADQQARKPARVFGALGAQQAEAFEGDLGISVATGKKRIERFGGHRVGPARLCDKTRVARQRQQAAATLATSRRQLGGEHAAQ